MSEPSWVVLSCTPRHLPAIRGIINHAILHTTALYEYEPRSESTMRRWMAAKRRTGEPILGIEVSPGVLAGVATWTPFRPRAAYKYSVEHSVYVADGFRGRGIGRSLLGALITEAQGRGLHMLVAGIDAGNAASRGLHKAAGFTCCGTVREAGFKFGRWLDLEFWQLLLPTPRQPCDGVAK
jgi:L-amino acid N-acyltransferase YncA